MTPYQTELLLGLLAVLSSLSSLISNISIIPEVAVLLISSGYLSFKGDHLDGRDNSKAKGRWKAQADKDSRHAPGKDDGLL